MQLTCPNCGEKIPSAHINIQQMVAVCPACDTVFRFTPPAPKAKRRKVKRPERLMLDETDQHMRMAFRTNFRLDKNEAFISSAIFSLVFTCVTALFIGQYLTERDPVLVLMAFIMGLAALFGYYWLARVVYNKTHIEAAEDQITVTRKPVPNFLTPPKTIDLAGVERIHYEETPTSQKEGYDMPRYGVWALLVDGSRRLIVNDVTVDYAAFIAQCLNEHVALNADPNTDRLADEDWEADAPSITSEAIIQAQRDKR